MYVGVKTRSMDNIYISLDEARDELKRRNDLNLKRSVEVELGHRHIPQFKSNPRSVLFRQICPADNGFEFFYYSAKYVNAEPLVLEYHDDMFTSINEEKKGLGRLRVTLEDGTKATVDIMDFHANEKKKLGECVLKTGDTLLAFHHNLRGLLNYNVEIRDNSNWFHDIGHAADYYDYFMLHFLTHGVLFDVFQTEEDKTEDVFTNGVVVPAIEKIKQKFGIKPLIVRLYPKNQSAEEDFYWWCYPPQVNAYIIEYAKEHNLAFKRVEI